MGQQKKYMQLYDEMVKLIQTGKLAPGDRLPTEQELSHTFAVSRQTVRQALGKMKEAGLISSLQGSGSFVSEKACAMRRTCRIAVITTYISTYIFPSILRGIEDVPRPTAIPSLKATNSIAKERYSERPFCAGCGRPDCGGYKPVAQPKPAFYRTLPAASAAFFNGHYPPSGQPHAEHPLCGDG
ncbi:MAG: GntR family transcriptional regulator [Ruthenibacterium sp.]